MHRGQCRGLNSQLITIKADCACLGLQSRWKWGSCSNTMEKHACMSGMAPTGLPTLLAASLSPLAPAVVLNFTGCIEPCPQVANASSGALAGTRVLLAVAELLIFNSDGSLAAVLTECCR